MIRAVIFDCFGVLTTDAWLPFKMAHFGHDPELLARTSELNRQSDAGLISTDDFLFEVADMAHLTALEVSHAISNNVPNTALFELVQRLKTDYKIGMLSNTSSNWLTSLFQANQLALFDAIALSFETHATKPQPEAYEGIAEQLGCSVEECVFTDDQERFVTGAQEAGMQAIWYQDNEQLQRDLAVLLADSKH